MNHTSPFDCIASAVACRSPSSCRQCRASRGIGSPYRQRRLLCPVVRSFYVSHLAGVPGFRRC